MYPVLRYPMTSIGHVVGRQGRITTLLLSKRLHCNASNGTSGRQSLAMLWTHRPLPPPSMIRSISLTDVVLPKRSYTSEQPSSIERYRDRIITVPNILSMTRLVLSPYLAYLLLQDHFTSALILFTAAGLTDLLDGWIARRYSSQKSLIGTVLDPVSDKILMCTLTVSLTAASLLPWQITAIILSRDIGLVTYAFYYRFKTLPPPVTLNRFFSTRHAPAEIHPLGISKLNTGLQLSLIFMSIAAPIFDFIHHPMLQILWFTTAATTVASGLSYMRSVNFVKHLKKSER